MCLYLPAGSSSNKNKGRRKPKLSPYWSAQFRGPSGRVVSIGTKIRERKLAKKLEGVWTRAAELGRNGFLSIDKAKQLLEECGQICRGDSLRQSESFIDSCLKASTGTGLNIVTVTDYFQGWLNSKEESGRNSRSTLARYSPVLDRFLAYLPDARRQAALSSVTPLDCAGFLREEKARGCSAVSANLSVKILRIAFNSARRQGLITSNPADATDLMQETPGARLPFSIEQVREILSVCDQEWRGLVMCGFYAGLRLGDASRLTWANVDLDRGLLIFQAQKTARRKKGSDKNTVVDLHRDLAGYFASLQRGVPAAPLFPTLSTRPVGSASGLSAAFRRIMDRAGILSPLGTGDGRAFRALSFHSLRHSYVSQLASAGVPIELRMALAGHSTSDMSLGYTHVNRSLTAAAIAQLPSIEKAA